MFDWFIYYTKHVSRLIWGIILLAGLMLLSIWIMAFYLIAHEKKQGGDGAVADMDNLSLIMSADLNAVVDRLALYATWSSLHLGDRPYAASRFGFF